MALDGVFQGRLGGMRIKVPEAYWPLLGGRLERFRPGLWEPPQVLGQFWVSPATVVIVEVKPVASRVGVKLLEGPVPLQEDGSFFPLNCGATYSVWIERRGSQWRFPDEMTLTVC
ncbi:MAG: hypothetical protein AAGK22_10540 [Acidobacteriota bacterium]